MKLSNRGLAALKRSEGLRLKTYSDVGGVGTIGYGHANQLTFKFNKDTIITVNQAHEILLKDVKYFEDSIKPLIKVKLTQNQWDAIVIFVFNIGVGAFSKSTLLKYINSGMLNQVPPQFMRWIYVNGKVNQGLVNRRQGEVLIWKGVYSNDS